MPPLNINKEDYKFDNYNSVNLVLYSVLNNLFTVNINKHKDKNEFASFVINSLKECEVQLRRGTLHYKLSAIYNNAV